METEQNLDRIQVLENQKEFQLLTVEQKIVLVAGEKIVEILTFINNLYKKYSWPLNEHLNDFLLEQIKKIEIQLNHTINNRFIDFKNNFDHFLFCINNLQDAQNKIREDLRKKSDCLYVLEDKFKNHEHNYLDFKIKVDELLQKANNNQTNECKQQFEEFLTSNKIKNIVQEQVESYLYKQDLFLDDSDFKKDDLHNDEIIKIYKNQLDNSHRLNELEKLLEVQNSQIKRLIHENQNYLISHSNSTKKHDLAFFSNTFLYSEPFGDNTLYYENELDNLKNVIVKIQKKFNTLFDAKTFFDVKIEERLNDGFVSINKKIAKIEEKIDLSKSRLTVWDSFLYEEDEDMKHDYYDIKKPLAGTKIRKINNYRSDDDFVDENNIDITIKELYPSKEFDSIEETKEKQKLVELEDIVEKQKEEIKALKTKKNDILQNKINELVESEVIKVLEKTNKETKTLKDDDITNDRLYLVLDNLKQLTALQQKTAFELEKQSNRLKELEDKIIQDKTKTVPKNQDFLVELEKHKNLISETFTIEKAKLLTEIELVKQTLNEKKELLEQKAEETNLVLEPIKRKRQQQFFYEIKKHSSPKLTRADLIK